MLNPRAFALASMLAVACQPMPPMSEHPSTSTAPHSGVTITLDRTRYAPGSQVELRVTNHTNDTVGFNPCTRIIERRQGDAWVTVPEPDRVCTMEIWLLDPHASRTGRTDLPASLTPGTYRLALVLTRESSGAPPATPAPSIRAASEPFQLQ
jgi:hypothetical protein